MSIHLCNYLIILNWTCLWRLLQSYSKTSIKAKYYWKYKIIEQYQLNFILITIYYSGKSLCLRSIKWNINYKKFHEIENQIRRKGLAWNLLYLQPTFIISCGDQSNKIELYLISNWSLYNDGCFQQIWEKKISTSISDVSKLLLWSLCFFNVV